MLKLYTLLLAFVCCLQFDLWGQTWSPLKRGDIVPDIFIENMQNYKSEKLRLRDYKGQWVLIDFWGAGCVGCVGGFPMLDSMQRKYEGKLKIILVSKNRQEQLDKFVQSIRRKVMLPDVPRASADKVLKKLFPYLAVPYHVWIDPEGRFYAGTSSENLTPENIDLLFKGKRPYFKPSVYVPYSEYTASSILEVAIGVQPNVRAEYSYFTGYVPKGSELGYESSKVDSTNQTFRRSFSNLSLLSFAQKIVPSKGNTKNGSLASRRVFYEIVDNESLIQPTDDGLIEDWKAKNLYSYEIQVSLDRVDSLEGRIRQDILGYLKSYANITVYEEKRKIRIVKIRLSDKGERIRSDTTSLEYRLFPRIQNTDFDFRFLRPIRNYYAYQNIYFEKDFDDLDFPVDINVGENWQNLDSLKAILAPQGIDLIEEEVEDMVLVISDRKKG